MTERPSRFPFTVMRRIFVGPECTIAFASIYARRV